MAERYVKRVKGRDVPMSAAEIATRKAEEAKENSPKPLPIDEQMQAIFETLPVEQQAAFGPLAASVVLFLERGNVLAARQVVIDADVPLPLAGLKNQLLALFG